MYELMPTPDEKLLFFRLDGEAAERYGAIGYMRADFGKSGGAFWTSWFDCQPNLKTVAFKAEFDNVINSLRNDGQEPPFARRRNLEAFCTAKPGKALLTHGSGYMIRTLDYSYYARCMPSTNNYEIYVFAYDNRWLLPELAGNHDLPSRCFSVLPSTGELILLSVGVSGYTPCDSTKANPEGNRLFADTSNRTNGITRAQEEAMLAGSLFGWNTPAAKPWRYNRDGTPRRFPPAKNEPER